MIDKGPLQKDILRQTNIAGKSTIDAISIERIDFQLLCYFAGGWTVQKVNGPVLLDKHVVTSVVFIANSPEGEHWMAFKGMGCLIAMKNIQLPNLGSKSFCFAFYEVESGREVSNAIRSKKILKSALALFISTISAL